MSSYHYSQLRTASQSDGEIRLLTLLPGKQGSPIRTILNHALIHSPPVYEALSYTWGNPTGKFNLIQNTRWQPGHCRTITVDKQYMNVTYNLEAALQHIRHEKVKKVLWVDAICIDQSNLDEKSGQVRLMATIYRQATRVVCWLGEGDHYANLAFDTLHDLCWAFKTRIWQYCARELHITPSKVSESTMRTVLEAELFSRDKYGGLLLVSKFATEIESIIEALNLIPISWLTWVSLPATAYSTYSDSRPFAELLVSDTAKLSDSPMFKERTIALRETFSRRAYWERLWVVQEMTNAKETILLCGSRWTNFRAMALVDVLTGTLDVNTGGSPFLPAINTLDSLKQIGKALWKASYTFAEFDPRKKSRPSLSRTVLLNRDRTSSEPRDAIYALIYVCEPIEIVLDYNKTVQEVYIGATRAIILQEKNLDIITLSNPKGVKLLQEPYVRKLPSWVPHFESSLEEGILNMKLFSAGWECDPNDSLYDPKSNLSAADSRVLCLTGCYHGTITTNLGKYCDDLNDDQSWSKLPLTEGYPTSHDASFWQTFLMDVYKDSNDMEVRMTENTEGLSNFETDLQLAWTTNKIPKRLFNLLKPVMYSGTQCITSNDLFIIVMGEPLVGDQIFFARGSNCPYIVRPTQADATFSEVQEHHSISSFHTLIGGVYIPGMMDGGVWSMLADGKVQEKSVYLI